MKYFQWNPCPIGPYPNGGSQSSRTANSSISMSPTQKLGAATPNSDDRRDDVVEPGCKGRRPAMMPMGGMDTPSPIAIAARVRGIVLLNFSQTNGSDGMVRGIGK